MTSRNVLDNLWFQPVYLFICMLLMIMFKLFFFYIIFFITNCSFLEASVSPTKRYWEQKASIEQVRSYYETKQYSQFYIGNEKENTLFQEMVPLLLDHYTPLLLEIVDYEELPGFFGYHGCSQQYRIYQDILKAVIEEIIELPLPDDFQFIRIPGDHEFDLEKGAHTFLQMFERKEVSIEEKRRFIAAFVLTKINHAFETKISLNQLSEEEFLVFWEPVKNMFEFIDGMAVEDLDDYFVELYELDWLKDMTWIEGIGYFDQNSNRCSMKIQKSTDLNFSIATILKQFLPDLNISHARKWVEEQLSPRKIFEMLLACGVCMGWDDWVDIVFPYLDHKEGQQSRLVSMNVSLFGNYERWGECGLYVLGANHAIAGGDHFLYQLLRDYFDRIGLNPALVKKLVQIAENELKNAGARSGCICQFFDKSSSLYSELDVMSFPSHSYGIPLKDLQPRDLVLGNHTIEGKNGDIQMRLVASNRFTLNPFGNLSVLRYEDAHPSVAKNIIKKMHILLHSATFDHSKKAAYKKKLEQLWDVQF